jgi:uncharacterized membrane protein YeaQ/YmgE (transglycosylase-associated protein family)
MRILIELINWLRIAISPLLIGVLIGGLAYLKMGDDGFVPGLLITAIGGIVGVIWATKIWKKQGTTNFISRIDASPELDKKQSEN